MLARPQRSSRFSGNYYKDLAPQQTAGSSSEAHTTKGAPTKQCSRKRTQAYNEDDDYGPSAPAAKRQRKTVAAPIKRPIFPNLGRGKSDAATVRPTTLKKVGAAKTKAKPTTKATSQPQHTANSSTYLRYRSYSSLFTNKKHLSWEGTPTNGAASATSTAKPTSTPITDSTISSATFLQYKQYSRLFANRKLLSWDRASTEPNIVASTQPANEATSAAPLAPPRDLNHDPVLLEIARALTLREPLATKPQPQGMPQVWATGREELCETLPYYRSYHGGCYMNGGTVYSFMLDGSSQRREYIDENVIICRAGGNMELDGKDGIAQGKDSSISDTQPQAVLNNLRQQNPVIIICGNKNTAAAVTMPHRFCVLGWFMPTHIWAEKSVGKNGRLFTSVRYRFERLDRATVPWFARLEPVLSTAQEAAIPPLSTASCRSCRRESAEIMLSGWMCFNEDCKNFWILEGGHLALSNDLVYHPAFLTHTSSWITRQAPFEVNPGLPDFGRQVGDNLQYISTRGLVCPQCGRCNQRYRFHGWECDTAGCDWKLIPKHEVVTATGLQRNPWDIVSTGPAHTKTTSKPIVVVDVASFHNYKVLRYTIPGIDGCIIHAKANRTVVEEAGGPDDMFAALQVEDIGLIRRQFGHDVVIKIEDEPDSNTQQNTAVQASAPHHEGTNDQLLQTPIKREPIDSVQPTPAQPSSSQLSTKRLNTDPSMAVPVETSSSGRMSAFSMNFGMPYKFVAGGESQSFENSAWPIRACRSRLIWALRSLLGEDDPAKEFNELLAIGYLEKQKIGFHDDGEAGLGPVIASLSLGAAATMSLRLKAKYFSGVSKAGVMTYSSPPPLEVLRSSGNANMTQADWQQRQDGFEELRQVKQNRAGRFGARSKELAKSLGLRCKQAQPLLDLHLTHGDIVIMQGEALQQYFEHAVEPHGSLRFALTCRQILPQHLTAEQAPAYEVLPDAYGYDGRQIRTAADADALQWERK